MTITDSINIERQAATLRVLAGEQEMLAALGDTMPLIAESQAADFREQASTLEAVIVASVERCSCCEAY